MLSRRRSDGNHVRYVFVCFCDCNVPDCFLDDWDSFLIRGSVFSKRNRTANITVAMDDGYTNQSTNIRLSILFMKNIYT